MSDWIDVNDALPVDTKSVLVWCPERMNIYTACWRDGQWIHFGGNSYSALSEEVTHWMHKPEPPEGAKS